LVVFKQLDFNNVLHVGRVKEAYGRGKPLKILQTGRMIFSQKLKGLKKEDVCVVLARFPDIQALAPMQALELKS